MGGDRSRSRGARVRSAAVAIHVHVQPDEKLIRKLDEIKQVLEEILAALGRVEQSEEAQMADLAQLQQEVSENGDAVASAVALLGALSQQIRDAGTDPAALADLANQLDAQSSALAQAVVENTPADPNAPRPDQTLPGDLPQ